MSDEFFIGEQVGCPLHHLQARRVTGKRMIRDANKTDVLRAKVTVRAERDFARLHKVAGFDIIAPLAEHLDPFRNDLSNSRALNYNIGAAPVSAGTDKIDTFLRCRLVRIQYVVSTKVLSQLQTVV